MAVEVRIPTLMREHVGGNSSVSVEGDTIGKAFASLVAEHPGLDGQLLGEDGELHRFVNVYRNDDDIRYLDKLDTALSDGDVVSIIPAVAGG